MDPAGPAALGIEIYARLASATKQVTSARAMAGTDSGEDGEAAKIEPTYSNTSDINRASQMLRRLVVCIIQVVQKQQWRKAGQSPLARGGYQREAWNTAWRSARPSGGDRSSHPGVAEGSAHWPGRPLSLSRWQHWPRWAPSAQRGPTWRDGRRVWFPS